MTCDAVPSFDPIPIFSFSSRAPMVYRFAPKKLAAWVIALTLFISISVPSRAAELVGTVVDSATGRPIPARVYVRNEADEHLFVSSAAPEGSAIAYREQWVPMANSVELHTTISAHPFVVDLPPGTYQIEIERGKEYLPLRRIVEIGDAKVEKTFPLTRMVNMAERGWYSGETHVHRRIHELPNVMPAEMLNVAFPVTFWTTSADAAPDLAPSKLRGQGPSPHGPREDVGYDPIRLGKPSGREDRYVIFPRNTEYEIFSVRGKPHTLGAIFLLNHRTVFEETAPPIGRIVKKARAEGAITDLDKHSWPWSMMLVPVAGIDLFELSNNSVWRTEFGFGQISLPLPPWATIETMPIDGDGGGDGDERVMTEWGWLQNGFEVYYALLNCGFRIAPTAGTASGVHPVPLGHSRVYVHTGDAFDEARWLEGLRGGRSFVTTGPMLIATASGQLPGETFHGTDNVVLELKAESHSADPVGRFEWIVNGDVKVAVTATNVQTDQGGWRAEASATLRLDRSSWVAVRITEPQPDGRKRFAHSAPWYVTVGDQKIEPRGDQVEYFIELMEAEIARNRPVLSAAALGEFEEALRFYRGLIRKE
jgi:hypothetical protein